MTEALPAKVGIVGAGTMGQGIAQVFASAGCNVLIYDVNRELVSNAIAAITAGLDFLIAKGRITQETKTEALGRIRPVESLQDVHSDLVIEAVVENLEVKQGIFAKLEEVLSSDSLLLSNTSSIQISRIASVLQYPHRFAGLHFFNPAPAMKLVEIVQGAMTSTLTVERLKRISAEIGKRSVVTQDSPGFIVNRVARLYYVEALKILEEGVADHITIDKLLRNAGFRMGPFELMDLIGLDVNLAVTKSIYEAFNNEPRFCPSSIQQQKVDEGKLGRKSGKGFYNYE